jgi:hypothetical protein
VKPAATLSLNGEAGLARRGQHGIIVGRHGVRCAALEGMASIDMKIFR